MVNIKGGVAACVMSRVGGVKQNVTKCDMGGRGGGQKTAKKA